MEQVVVRRVSEIELAGLAPAIAALLASAVDAGASLDFIAPLTPRRCREHGLSLAANMRSGTRMLVVAEIDGEIVGSGQLELALGPTAQHRAEVHELVVDPAWQGRGIGKALMTALHAAAIERGRSLVLIATRRGERAERFCKRLDYLEGGVIAGYAMGPAGQRFDVLSLYRQFIP